MTLLGSSNISFNLKGRVQIRLCLQTYMASLNKRMIFISTEHIFPKYIIACKMYIFDAFISVFLTSDIPLIRSTSAHVNLCFGHVGRDDIKESHAVM